MLALGTPAIFHSIEEGEHLDGMVLVMGYVIMRLGLVAQWYRAYRDDPEHRPTTRAYIVTLLVAQVGWVVLVLLDPPLTRAIAFAVVLLILELSGPVVAEGRWGTPWHGHHIAERYGLLAIIALGEGVVGTIGALQVLTESVGWTTDAVVLLISGVVLTFGMWWTYFMMPSGDVLHRRRDRVFVWGYGHIPLYAAIAAVGAGLHVFAYYLDKEHADFEVKIGAVGTVLTVAAPLAVYSLGLFAIYYHLTRAFDVQHTWMASGTAAIILAGVGFAAGGLSPVWALLIVSTAPVVTIVGYETVGARLREEKIAEMDAA